ncbi:uncharacterized protein [Hyperolius riggenbachi]|uniref:uncharacterized protein n=1 Tax=Hyperolius riggenbachi TaxID=752182 RepID=UPI0035A30318
MMDTLRSIKSLRLSEYHDNKGFDQILMQIFGLPRSGKSSFINSCEFALDVSKFKKYAKPGHSKRGKSAVRRSHQLTDSIWMVNNPGLRAIHAFHDGEIFAQLGDFLPRDEELEWSECKETLYRQHDRLNDKDRLKILFCEFIVPVFVHSISNPISEEEIPLYKELLDTTRKMTGMNPFVVLTHKNHKGKNSMTNIFKGMGIKKIFTVENYAVKNHQPVREKHEEMLHFFIEVINEVKLSLKDRITPKDERDERLRFVVKYINRSDEQKTEEEQERRMREQQKKKMHEEIKKRHNDQKKNTPKEIGKASEPKNGIKEHKNVSETSFLSSHWLMVFIIAVLAVFYIVVTKSN